MSANAALGAVSREPQQGRGRASYERMLVAAEKLMIRHGNDDFTLSVGFAADDLPIGLLFTPA